MPDEVFTVDTFGGLDLYNDPEEVGPSTAVDLLNVDIDQHGRLRSRDGSTALTTSASNAQSFMGYYNSPGGPEYIVAQEGTVLKPYDLSSGSAATTQTATVTSNNAFARFGDPTHTRLYVAAGTLYRLDGTTWTAISGVPISPTMACVTANDNRLVICDGSTIYWSDAGAPETFSTNNKIQLWPGDGETIVALVRWRDYVIAFKQTKFAVFYSTTIDGTGNPVFNYRAVDAGRGCVRVGQAIAADDGVYFVDPTGIYATTGDVPKYMSRALEPWIVSGASPGLPGLTLTSTFLAYSGRRLYVVSPGIINSTPTVTVYDSSLDSWVVWEVGTGGVGALGVPSSSGFRGLYYADNAGKCIARMDPTVATDLGVAVPWHWKSGLSDLGKPGQVKITRESKIVGTGTATLQVATYDGFNSSAGALDTGGAVTMGTAPVPAEGWQLIDREGVFFQHQLSGTTATVVSRLQGYVSSVKDAGVA